MVKERIFALHSQGKKGAEIARELNISRQLVHFHLKEKRMKYTFEKLCKSVQKALESEAFRRKTTVQELICEISDEEDTQPDLRRKDSSQ
jgi:orotate phosphoribosyltransferase-like protein